MYFNPRAPVGRDDSAVVFYSSCNIFQSPRPCGARRQCRDRCHQFRDYFNPRAPVGRDGAIPFSSRTVINFNPRAPVGRDRLPETGDPLQLGFQSPRPCGARLLLTPDVAASFAKISIPAPLWGATSPLMARDSTPKYFNPRAPVGRDLILQYVQILCRISIPAPLWGATRRRSASTLPPVYFNPRAPVGRDFSDTMQHIV